MFDKIFGDFIEMGINMILCGVIFSGLALSMGLSYAYHEKQLENHIAVENIKEQRNVIFYDNTYLYQQDVVSTILTYKGDRDITVELSNGTKLDWIDYNYLNSNKYKVSYITNIIPEDYLYKSNVVRNVNNEVIGYTFEQYEGEDN